LDCSNSSKPFKGAATVVLCDVRNKVVDLKGIQQTGVIVNREGHPINSLFLLRSAGLLSAADFNSGGDYLHTPTQFGVVAAGDIRYLNTTDGNVRNAGDREVLGSTIPRYTYSFNLYL